MHLHAQEAAPYNQNASYEQYMAYQQSQVNNSRNTKENKDKSKVYQGFSGGVMVHLGYAFSENPEELFRNGTLKDVSNLPSTGVNLGIGGAVRFHLYQHLRLGGEGHVSTMPLQKSGSNLRTAWGGALVDAYWTIGKFMPMLGCVVGGGSMRRLYVPTDDVKAYAEGDSVTIYNASSTKTAFFLLDPYIGFEIAMSSRLHLLFKVDYALAFGKSKSLWTQNLSMSNFVTPSGPRLYIGFIFNHDRK